MYINIHNGARTSTYEHNFCDSFVALDLSHHARHDSEELSSWSLSVMWVALCSAAVIRLGWEILSMLCAHLVNLHHSYIHVNVQEEASVCLWQVSLACQQ